MQQRLSFREWLVTRLGGVPARVASAAEHRAFEAGFEEGGQDEPLAVTADGTTISLGYAQMDQQPRDLSAISQEKAIEAVYRLWESHPLAQAIIEIYVDYILGDGVTIEADNPDVQDALDRFWFDPVNRLGDPDGGIGDGTDELVRELILFGEELILLFPRTGEDQGGIADGLLRYGTVDPGRIYSIITDPGNQRDILAVRLKSKTGGPDGPVYKLVRNAEPGQMMEGARDLRGFANWARMAEAERPARPKGGWKRKVKGREWVICETSKDQRTLRLAEAETPADVEPAGECMLHQINKISTGSRGRPVILPLVDWLDRLDQVFFDGAEHVALLNMFSWDLKIEGGSETTAEPELNLKKQAQKVARMRPGSVYAHNEKAALEPKNPDLKTADLETIVRQLRVFIAGGGRIPEHWIAEGGYTNRATAAEMGQPTYKMLAKKQAIARRMLAQLCRYQIDVLVQLGLLPEMVDVLDENGQPKGDQMPAREAFRVVMPDINVQDTLMAARTFDAVARAVLTLTAGNLLPKQPAVELLAQAAELLGVTIDVQAVLGDLEGMQTSPALADLANRGAGEEQSPNGDQAEDGDEEA